MTTKLYHWRSEALKQYGLGHLISFGESVYEARDRILADLDKELKEYFSHRIYPGAEYDEDDLVDFENWRKQIEADLTIVGGLVYVSDSIYIRGSE